MVKLVRHQLQEQEDELGKGFEEITFQDLEEPPHEEEMKEPVDEGKELASFVKRKEDEVTKTYQDAAQKFDAKPIIKVVEEAEELLLQKDGNDQYIKARGMTGLQSNVMREIKGKDPAPEAIKKNIVLHFIHNIHTYNALDQRFRKYKFTDLRYRLQRVLNVPYDEWQNE